MSCLFTTQLILHVGGSITAREKPQRLNRIVYTQVARKECVYILSLYICTDTPEYTLYMPVHTLRSVYKFV